MSKKAEREIDFTKLADGERSLIIMGVCQSCKSILYLGDRTCEKCGAPVGDSVTEDDLERLYQLFEPNKPEPPTIVGGYLNQYGVPFRLNDTVCYTTNGNYVPMMCSSDPF